MIINSVHRVVQPPPPSDHTLTECRTETIGLIGQKLFLYFGHPSFGLCHLFDTKVCELVLKWGGWKLADGFPASPAHVVVILRMSSSNPSVERKKPSVV